MTADTFRRIRYRCFTGVVIGLAATSVLAQTPPPGAPQSQNPVCARLEAQLTALDRGTTDAGRLDQLKRLEDAANKQQFDIDRLNAQSARAGCEGSGFFLFGGQPPQCGPLNAQLQQMRANLDRIQADAERLRYAGSEREGQRRGLLLVLAQNDCGPQYRTAAQTPQRGFLETLFGSIPLFGNNPIMTPQPGDNPIIGFPGAPSSSTYRTLCVRMCDGYYFPISSSATQNRFQEDEKACQRQCPAAEVALYSHRNPGEDVNQAVSISGQPYTELPNAFLYRKEIIAACGCRRQGESWAQALKNLDNRTTIESGDILVDEQRARQMSMPKVDAQGRAIKLDLRGARPDPKAPKTQTANEPTTATIKEGPAEPDRNRKVRSVGPTFLPAR